MNRSACLIVLVILMSCIEEVTPPQIEDAEQKVVVNGLIAPGLEEINVQVSRSTSAFGFVPFGQSDNITNAEVTISNGISERTLVYDFNLDQYTLDADLFPIEVGGTYRVNVVTDLGTVYGETTVPNGVEQLTSAILNRDNILNVSWIDIADELNYYRLIAEGEVGGEFGYTETFYFDTDEFVSDVNRDGELLSGRGEGFVFGAEYESVIVRLLSCDKNYYDYYEILSNYVGEDPFADPVRLPSNIVGGLGIFTSVQISEFTIEL